MPAPPPPVTLHYAFTPELLKRGMRHHVRYALRPGLRWTIYGFGFVFILLFCQALAWGRLGAAAFFAVMALYFMVLRGPLLVALSVRRFARRPDSGALVTWTIGPEQLVCKQDENNQSSFTWDHLVKALVGPDVILLYPLERVFYILPRETLGEEAWEQLTAWTLEKARRCISLRS